ncbi:hypothetical protein SAMN04487850_1111 [Prevotella aff. ruminicola Tc2-24]|uniref:Uncharacterized protein n=1 Tax=Prevotella aff. ruminicola Tc2-24 TaxID=81582 RepID=A0A1I0NB96_9BACT|nr:hypothetical protein SAMN04487850_1111 [Prevotella aff. ruminicola Tc2-24]
MSVSNKLPIFALDIKLSTCIRYCMKQLLILLTCCLLVSCGTSMSCEKFFGTVSTKDIPDVSLDSVSFRTSYIEGDCVSCGTISEPLFDCDIKYDTLSHYSVIVLGKVVFEKDSCQKEDYKRVYAVEINNLVVQKQHFPREFYSDSNHKWRHNTPWKRCPLPKKVLEKIRNDFLKRKKYVRYTFKEADASSVSESYCYRLY